MNQYTIDHFTGLVIQPNSFTVNPGTFDDINNAIVSQDYLITKSTGLSTQYQFVSTQKTNRLFDYSQFTFSITQNTLYKLYQSSVQGAASSTNGSTTVTITKTSHGLRTNDYISNILVTNTDAFLNSFPNRHVDISGIRQVTVINANTFTIQSLTAATANSSTAANAFSYTYYTPVSGQSFSITSSGVVRSRTVASNKNLYFTADDGLIKLESSSLPILRAGIPQGLDIQGYTARGLLDPGFGNYTGILLPKQSLAYRMLWGRRDANNNLILGAPSQFVIVNNNILIDIADADISFTSPTVTVTQPLHGYTTGQSIYIYNALTPSPAITDGTSYDITVIDPNTFSFNIGTATWIAPRSFSYGVPVTPILSFSIPSEITDNSYIYQVYRSTASENNTTPLANYRLLTEANIDNVQITATFVEYVDLITNLLIQSNAQLYTNSTQEGELQANSRPPRAKDVALFRNYVFYANNKDYGYLNLSLQAPNNIVNLDTVTIDAGVYEFRGNPTNEAVGNDRVRSSCTDDGSGGLIVTQNNHGFLLNDVVYVLFSNGITGLTNGFFTIYGPVTANTFKIASGISGTGSVTYQGVFNSSTSRRLVTLYNTTATGSSLSIAIDVTARALVEAINRNPASTVYAQYVSSLTGTVGKITLQSKQFSNGIFTATASTTLTGTAFAPELPTSGTDVQSQQDTLINQIAVSKVSQPEAVPLVNNFLVGTQEAAILRILPLRDSLIILKEDGIFRLNGTDPNNFIITPLDTTVFCRSTESAVVLNNSVYCFSNQGVVQITDSGARIISRPIEPYLTSFTNNTNVEAFTAGVAYESERLYYLSIVTPNSDSTVAEIIYVYNYLNDSWSSITLPENVFGTGRVSSLDDSLFCVPSTKPYTITKERKNHTKVDYTAEAYPCQTFISMVATATVTASFNTINIKTKFSHPFKVGDVITISKVAQPILNAFSGGAADVQGIRVVTSVADIFNFSFTADTSATLNVVNSLFYKRGISEYTATAVSLIGNRTITVTTLQPHNLTSGQSIQVNSTSSNLSTSFSVASNVTGNKPVIVLSPTVFTITGSINALSSVTGSINFSDKTQNLLNVTINVASNIIPQAGDAIILGNNIYKTEVITKYAGNLYLVTLTNPYTGLSDSQTFLHSGYTSRIKLNPVTMGNPGLLKYISEFQSSFRNQSSCSSLIVNFSNDAFPGTTPTFWNTKVGSAKAPITFGGWGQQTWGTTPWDGTSIQREYNTSSAVLMRIYIPKECFVGTYIQPIITHNVAGESIEIQSMSLFNQLVSPRASK